MANSSYEIGQEVHEMLKSKGIENPIFFNEKTSLRSVQDNFHNVCTELGMDLDNESVKDTPKRLAKMYVNEICSGLDYSNFPAPMLTDVEGSADEIILIRNIEIKSLCEHHFMPVIGKAHIAYIPKQKIMGLSKFNRVAQFFARRPQLQERLTEQVHATLAYLLETEDVAVVMNAEHFCVKFRGVEDINSDTVTSKMSGKFKDVPEARAELMALIGGSK